LACYGGVVDVATARMNPDLDAQRFEQASHLAGEMVRVLADGVRAPLDTLAAAVACMFSGGHLLIEDVPGVGKTVLAKSLARAAGCHYSRLQCTSDLLPSDVTGVHVYDQRNQTFEFRPGPVFTNILLADEINRASPKTQSALLESMEEHQVTVDGQTRQLPRPFMVIATMNPVEYEGTFPLPEAQLDRFALAISIGYPPAEAEADMLLDLADKDPVAQVDVVGDELRIADAILAAESVYVDPSIARYVVDIVTNTRQDRRLVLGASPRAALTVLRMAKATALIGKCNYVGPEHVKHVAPAVLAHRLVMGSEARVSGITGSDVVNEALRAVRAPAL
jgi:MoxR-like ATPase